MLFLLYVNTLFIGCGSDIKIKSQEPSDDTNNEASSEPSNEVSSEVSSEPSSEVSSEPASEPSSDPMLLPFNEAIFASTHNSYTGGDKGSITDQLNAGIRVLELDFHIDNHQETRDYQLGHLWAEEGVELGNGNPDTTALSQWLMQISNWSDNNVGHAPITILLDSKNHIMGNIVSEDDSPFLFNSILVDVFGSKLYTSEEHHQNGTGWPTVQDLQDRVLVVLSGSEISRIRYNRDEGVTPAIAINDNGDVLHVHENGAGSIWYWSGKLQNDGSIDWLAHNYLTLGFNPAVDLNNDGYFVVVFEGFVTGKIWYQSGQILGDSNLLHLQGSTEYDTGALPSIRFTDRNATTLHEVHSSALTGQSWEWSASLDSTTGEILWSGNMETSQGRYPVDESFSDAGVVATQSTTDGSSIDTLRYTSGLIDKRIRVPQIAFIEFQFANDDDLLDDALFFAGDSTIASFIPGWNDLGGVTRIWGFDPSIQFIPNYAATDEPFSVEYQQWLQDNNAVDVIP